MSDRVEDFEITPLVEITDTDDGNKDEEQIVIAKKLVPTQDNYGATPLEDKFGRSLWIRTRMCFCDDHAETDCRFHSMREKGWEECPSLELAKANPKLKGRWLWARNPLYGKPLTEEEQKELDAQEQALNSIKSTNDLEKVAA